MMIQDNLEKSTDKAERQIPSIAYGDYPRQKVDLDQLSVKFMKQFVFVPISLEDNLLTIAISDPMDEYVANALTLSYEFEIEICQGDPQDIMEAIDRLYGSGSQSIENIIEEAGKDLYEINGTDGENIDNLKDLASEAPIIRLVNRLIVNAVEIGASDIHFEPFEKIFKIRYRIDGVLHEIETPPIRLQAAIISRVKIMAKMDIAERRLPQDGGIKLRISDREIDFRVSTVPTLYGESLVMRILDKESLTLDLGKLGFPNDVYEKYTELIRQPYGMILVTGPTGSGKTSTLYTTLNMINSSEKKVITLEDPVEYQLVGVNQIQVKPKIGLTFAAGLRSIVRQDPDIILVGEIRDRETAALAVRAALTGHLVLSTLHTPDAVSSIPRLRDLGVDSYLIAAVLRGVIAQRLLRRICPACRRPAAALGRVRPEAIGGTAEQLPASCPRCGGVGYSGRFAAAELFGVSPAVAALIAAGAGREEIERLLRQEGMVPIGESAARSVAVGRTSRDELLRCGLTE